EESITRWMRPEIELRGRRQRLGTLPLFLTLESSADLFTKGTPGAEYGRFDLFPVFSSQLSPVPWVDVNASFGFRDTYYTKSQRRDRKSTRLNSSHVSISYAVFCLKNKMKLE